MSDIDPLEYFKWTHLSDNPQGCGLSDTCQASVSVPHGHDILVGGVHASWRATKIQSSQYVSPNIFDTANTDIINHRLIPRPISRFQTLFCTFPRAVCGKKISLPFHYEILDWMTYLYVF